MPERPFEPTTLSRVEFPCIWVPDGCEMPPTTWGNPAFFRAMWIPGGHQDPRPGYPWIEFGRMALPPDGRPVAARPQLSDRVPAAGGTNEKAGQSITVPGSEAQVPFARHATAHAHPIEDAADAVRDAQFAAVLPDISATIGSWNAVSDLGVALAALGAVSTSNPIVQSLAQSRYLRDQGPTVANSDDAAADQGRKRARNDAAIAWSANLASLDA